MLDVGVAEPKLQPPGVVARIGQQMAAGVAQLVRMAVRQPCPVTCGFDRHQLLLQHAAGLDKETSIDRITPDLPTDSRGRSSKAQCDPLSVQSPPSHTSSSSKIRRCCVDRLNSPPKADIRKPPMFIREASAWRGSAGVNKRAAPSSQPVSLLPCNLRF